MKRVGHTVVDLILKGAPYVITGKDVMLRISRKPKHQLVLLDIESCVKIIINVIQEKSIIKKAGKNQLQ